MYRGSQIDKRDVARYKRLTKNAKDFDEKFRYEKFRLISKMLEKANYSEVGRALGLTESGAHRAYHTGLARFGSKET